MVDPGPKMSFQSHLKKIVFISLIQDNKYLLKLNLSGKIRE